MSKKIRPYKGGRVVKKSTDVTLEISVMLGYLRKYYGISLGDLVEEAVRQKFSDLAVTDEFLAKLEKDYSGIICDEAIERRETEPEIVHLDATIANLQDFITRNAWRMSVTEVGRLYKKLDRQTSRRLWLTDKVAYKEYIAERVASIKSDYQI